MFWSKPKSDVSELSQLFNKLGSATLSLYKEKEFLNRIFNSHDNLLIVTDDQTGEIVFSNSTAERLLGDIKGKNIRQVLPQLSLLDFELENWKTDVIRMDKVGKLGIIHLNRIRSQLNGKPNDYNVICIYLLDDFLLKKLVMEYKDERT